MNDLNKIAGANLCALKQNPYPGRGIILGLDEEEKSFVQVYWIMGRSPNSRNRIIDAEFGRVFTLAADMHKVQDTSLIIYNAMQEGEGFYVVSNGKQTDSVFQALQRGSSFEDGLKEYQYEPDSPNFTPRITGVCSLRSRTPIISLSILYKSPWDEACQRSCFHYYSVGAGFGYGITTYSTYSGTSSEGDPLPAFTGNPWLLPTKGGLDEIVQTYWDSLNEDNRVSLAVKMIDLSSGQSRVKIVNKYTKI